MVKRALTSYDTVCWLDRLSFAQEMRKSPNIIDKYKLALTNLAMWVRDVRRVGAYEILVKDKGG